MPRLAPTAQLFAALALGLLACGRGPALETLEWTHDSGARSASLHLPASPGPHPGLVLVPGAGPAQRDDPWFEVHAKRLARSGFAVLAYDKRAPIDGTRASLEQQALDVRAALALLRDDGRIDSERLGLVAVSQGGAVALLAARDEPGLRTLVAVSFSPHSPAEQVPTTLEHRLEQAGFDGSLRERARELALRLLESMRSGVGLDERRGELDAERHRTWLEAARMPELCQADFDVEGFRKLPMDFDPLEVLRATRVPVLVLQGAEDDLVPGPQAANLLSGFASEHDLELQVRLIAGAGHGLRQRNGVRFDTEKGWLEPAWQWPEPYWSALETWLHAHTAPNPRRGVAAEPPEMVR